LSTQITVTVEKQVAPVPKEKIPSVFAKLLAKVSPPPPSGPKIVTLSGFRDAILEKQAVLKGWEVKGNFSKAVTLVVVKEFGKDTEKTKKAREHGIKIITREDFAKML
jgi:hypothetical protein